MIDLKEEIIVNPNLPAICNSHMLCTVSNSYLSNKADDNTLYKFGNDREEVKTSLESGDNVYLRGFGSFIIKTRAEKTGRNISKNTAIVIDEHYIPSFKPSKVFVEKIKGSKKIK